MSRSWTVLLDGGQGGDCALDADTLAEAISEAKAWALLGDWGEGGCIVDLLLTELEPDCTCDGIADSAPECASCTVPALARDSEGDPACAVHAADPMWDGVTLLDWDGHRADCAISGWSPEEWFGHVEIPQDEEGMDLAARPRAYGQPVHEYDEHDWQTPLDLVGGCRENPGVRGHGGLHYTSEEYCPCGAHRVSHSDDQRLPCQGPTSWVEIDYPEGLWPWGEDCTEAGVRVEVEA